MPPAPPASNDVFTVSQLTRKIRTLLQIQVGEVWVDGEISNLRPNKSGHVYFTLKDAHSQISCVLFRGRASRLRVEMQEGMQVQAFGEVSVYEARGSYQLIVHTLQEKGLGALQARFEALKRSLEAEGLFDESRKKPVPAHPRVIALVTSPTSAAVRDLLKVLGRRAPGVRVLVAPVRVQGQGAEEEIAAAVEMINRESGRTLPVVDTLIVGRGGGSLEDLWCFNEEITARAIAASEIPVISAVGHEIDFTIADFAADLRAATPSAAAELAVPDHGELRRRVATLGQRSRVTTNRLVEHHARLLTSRTPDSLRRTTEFFLRENQQGLDTLDTAMDAAWNSRLGESSERLQRAAATLASARPDIVLDHAQARLADLAGRACRAADHATDKARTHVDALAGMLTSLGPDAVLQRGFSLTLDAKGKPVRSASALKKGEHLTTRFADGSVESQVL